MRAASWIGLVLVGCGIEGAPEVDPAESAIVYGVDNRLDWYQVSDTALRAAASSTVGLFDRRDLTRNADGTYTVATGGTLRQSVGVCSAEPFSSQPVAAGCSGFQVGEDLIATAGHCVSSADCTSTRFVFGFRMDSASQARTRVAGDDVYSCSQIVSRQVTGTSDYAVVRVDRPIVGHAPLAIRRSGKVATGQSLVLIGHPSGLPTKIAAGATVRDNAPSAWFAANLDSYGGNSGSAVLNATTLEVEGILVRGNNDYDWNGSCYVSNQCSDNNGCGGSWEESTRTTQFAASVPALPTPADLALRVVGAAVAGAPLTLEVSGAPAGEVVWVVTGVSAGSTEVPGCPGLFVEQSKAYALGSGTAGAGGVATVAATARAGWAGKTRELTAVSLSTCLVSEPLLVSF